MTPATLKKSLAHLRREPKLARVIDSIKEKPKFKDGREPFESLCSAIIYQQLSGKAAATIHGRFIELYKKKLSRGEKSPFAKTSCRNISRKISHGGCVGAKGGVFAGFGTEVSRWHDRPE